MVEMLPDPSPPPPPSLEDLRGQISRLEDAHRAKGLPLSGRVIHVCHHLPVEIIRVVPAESEEAGGSMVPPITPEFKPEEAIASIESHDAKWRIHARTAHTAMVSGMRSLSASHEQLVVAWTGEVLLQTQSQPTPHLHEVTALPNLLPDGAPNGNANGASPIKPEEKPLMVWNEEFSPEEQVEVANELNRFTEVEAQIEESGGKLRYVPVFLSPDVSKGHYEGFCKKSESFL